MSRRAPRTTFRRPSASAAPVNTAPPSISGTAEYDATLTAQPGTWTPAPASYAYRWLRDGAPIPDAVEATYVAGLDDLGHRVGLGRSAFSARFTRLVGQSMYRYLIVRRMEEAAFLLESSDEGIARIATRVGYETVAAFSKVFLRHHGLSPGRYRAVRRSDGDRKQEDVLEAEVAN